MMATLAPACEFLIVGPCCHSQWAFCEETYVYSELKVATCILKRGF